MRDTADSGLSGEPRELPLRHIGLEHFTSEDKECPPQGGPDVGDSEIETVAVCWDVLRRLDKESLVRAIRYLNFRAESWHQQPSPSEDF